MKSIYLYLYVVILVFSGCVDNLNSKNSISPVVLTDYPKSMDSTLIDCIKKNYDSVYPYRITLGHSVVTKKMNGEQIRFLDTNYYSGHVVVLVDKKEEIWHFSFNKKLKLLGFNFIGKRDRVVTR